MTSPLLSTNTEGEPSGCRTTAEPVVPEDGWAAAAVATTGRARLRPTEVTIAILTAHHLVMTQGSQMQSDERQGVSGFSSDRAVLPVLLPPGQGPDLPGGTSPDG